MIDIAKEQLVRMSQVPRLLPPGPSGNRVHVSAVYRWALHGVRGVKLEAIRIGVATYSSHEALQRFAEHLSRPRDDPQEVKSPSPLYRQRQIDQAARRVDEILNHRPAEH